MNTIDSLHNHLDANPNDHTARLVLADALQEAGGDFAELADGYRALAYRRAVPAQEACTAVRDCVGLGTWNYTNGRSRLLAKTFHWNAELILATELPNDWCEEIQIVSRGWALREIKVWGISKWDTSNWNTEAGWFGYGPTRRETEDLAALAFTNLPPERQVELLQPAEDVT